MIDHVSVPVRSLEPAARFYEAVLGALGYEKLIVRTGTIGFGKRYAEFWINLRPGMSRPDADCGAHVCLRGRSREEVDAFHAAGLALGGSDDGLPGPREHDDPSRIYYAAFLRTPTATASRPSRSSRADQRRARRWAAMSRASRLEMPVAAGVAVCASTARDFSIRQMRLSAVLASPPGDVPGRGLGVFAVAGEA